LAPALVIGAISFNAALCFLNTRGVAITGAHTMASEAILIGAALLACRNYLNATHMLVLVLVLTYALALAVLRFANVPSDGFDPKIVRDLMIPIVFFLLGKAVNDLQTADRIVFVATAILLAFAVFELFFLQTFLQVFSVADYYIARGTIDLSNSGLHISQGLMVSGVRPDDQGRFLLSFLGNHSVSSLFLEPSTLGNFGAVVAIWAAVRSRMEGKLFIWCALGGLALVILSDTRFNAYFLLIGIIVMLTPLRLATLAVFAMPYAVTVALYLMAASAEAYEGGDLIVEGLEMYDRLLYSGRVLLGFDVQNWFGLATSRAQTFDSGYGYLISSLGFGGATALWILFLSLRGSNPSFYVFRNVMAVLFTALLTISASQFTIKIAAFLWFLVGALSVARIESEKQFPASGQALVGDDGASHDSLTCATYRV
jgi:putative polymerase